MFETITEQASMGRWQRDRSRRHFVLHRFRSSLITGAAELREGSGGSYITAAVATQVAKGSPHSRWGYGPSASIR